MRILAPINNGTHCTNCADTASFQIQLGGTALYMCAVCAALLYLDLKEEDKVVRSSKRQKQCSFVMSNERRCREKATSPYYCDKHAKIVDEYLEALRSRASRYNDAC